MVRISIATRRSRSLLVLACTTAAAGAGEPVYFPPPGAWEHRAAAEVGMDAEALAAAIEFATQHETDWPKDFSRQEEMFGALLGPIPTDRAGTNGIVIRHGYVVAEFGETERVDPTYSVAKSMLSTVAGIAVREGKIANLDAAVGATIHDGGYDSPHNAGITWRNHLQQESEWEGEMWGKQHDFVGRAAFGSGERAPRALEAPGSHYEYNDVRINRFALSLLRVFGRPVPDVFREEVMEPIGASKTWRWIPYDESYVEIDGARMPSVSGGTRWGGGVWISSWDMARFGYLWLRGGRWGEREILPAEYVRAALTPSAHGPDYGFLWWLNTRGENWPGLPASAFGARGAGNNTIFVSPEHDLLIVWRWHAIADKADAQLFRMVVEAIRE
jgi:CubicO group peptidase (beta-lactamase class C family)